MKHIYKLTWLVFVAALFFVSCDDDGVPAREESYVPDSAVSQAYFPSDNDAKFFASPDQSSTTVTIRRIETNSAVSIDLKTFDEEGVFTVPSKVDFPAGEAEVSIEVTFSNLKPFVDYAVEITLDEKATNPYLDNKDGGTSNFILTVQQSDWADHSQGTFVSSFFGFTEKRTLQYSEILKKYRIKDTWAEGYHYIFAWEGAEITPDGEQDSEGRYIMATGASHSTYGAISARTDAAASSYTAATKTFYFDIKWRVAAGTFGVYPEEFVLD
ncbi:hypothetical protein EMN47_03580 [Prolixibacteraceae bacterium JC049]|nr:hypothetical protein [Prolixibacteraceae bacterium JC049]